MTSTFKNIIKINFKSNS